MRNTFDLAAAAIALSLSAALIVAPDRVIAAGLECPETSAAVPNLLAGAQQIERLTAGNEVDLSNEIRGLINQVQTEKPGISNDETINVLIAAYCPVVAGMAQAAPAEKWRLMRNFDAALRREISASSMPAGSLIIASVPLPPPVFRSLTSQAEAAGQTPSQFMAAILTGAAKR